MSEYGNGNCLALVEVCALLSATLVYSGTKANLNFHKTGSSVALFYYILRKILQQMLLSSRNTHILLIRRTFSKVMEL